ncbi:MAG: OmpA family protein [Neisseriaceae bacterium]|nr:MAG: OmpA family protein [Neisseriaceae bacterium]
MNKLMSISSVLGVIALSLSACVSVGNGQTRMHKSALYGLTSATTCAIIGATSAPDGKSNQYATNAGVFCGVIGAIAGSVAENNASRLQEDIRVLDSKITVTFGSNNSYVLVSMPEYLVMSDSITLNSNIYPVLQRVGKYLQDNPMIQPEIYGYVNTAADQSQNLLIARQEAQSVANYLRNYTTNVKPPIVYPKGSNDNAQQHGNRVEILLKK